MLSTCSESSERVTTAHRAKLAYIYVRQSTAGQVRQHQESTELQYHLVERAITLGWPRERVEDGLYCLKALDLLKERLEDPERYFTV